jgi:hypothetical protein
VLDAEAAQFGFVRFQPVDGGVAVHAGWWGPCWGGRRCIMATASGRFRRSGLGAWVWGWECVDGRRV